MSAASKPARRTTTPSNYRNSLFWPILILLVGLGLNAANELMALEDQLDEITQNVDKMDTKIRLAQYEKTKFLAIAKDVLALAPKDPNAEKVVVDFKIRQLPPTLLGLIQQPSPATTNAASTNAAASTTNIAPVHPVQATNVAPGATGAAAPK